MGMIAATLEDTLFCFQVTNSAKKYESAIEILDNLSYDSQDSFWFATRIVHHVKQNLV